MIRYSAEWYKAVFDAIPDQVLVKGPRSEILLANRAFLENYGMTHEELVETIDSDNSDPDDTLQYVRDDHQVFSTGQPLRVTEPVTGIDGVARFVETVKGAIQVQDSTVGTVGVSRPIEGPTPEAGATRDLRKQTAEMLRQLIAGSPAPMMVLDAQFRCVCISPQFEALTRTEVEIGASYQDTLEPTLPLIEHARRVLDHAETVEVDVVLEAQRRELKVYLRPWPLPGYEVGGVLVHVVDMTEARKVGRQLRESHESLGEAQNSLAMKNRQLSCILEALSFGVLVADRNGALLMFNSEAERLLGRDPTTITSEEWAQSYRTVDANRVEVPAEEQPLVRALFERRTVTDQILGMETTSGHLERWLSVSAVPLEGAGDAAAVSTFTDISPMIRVQRDLEEFAYVAAHDLKEPLRMVSGFVSLLKEEYGGQLPEEAQEYMDFAIDGAERMKLLIQDVLAVSQASNRSLELQSLSLSDMVTAALGNLSAAQAEAGAKVLVGELPKVQGDPVLLTALIQNLLANALKFRAPERPPVVQVDATESNGMWQISVSDNGIGIEPAHQAKVFKMFQRLHTQTDYPGTGIGLALAKRIVERHGGTIGLESEAGAGTTFWFTIPKDTP